MFFFLATTKTYYHPDSFGLFYYKLKKRLDDRDLAYKVRVTVSVFKINRPCVVSTCSCNILKNCKN